MITVVKIARDKVKVVVNHNGEFGVFYLSEGAYTELRKALIAIPAPVSAPPDPAPEPQRSIA